MIAVVGIMNPWLPWDSMVYPMADSPCWNMVESCLTRNLSLIATLGQTIARDVGKMILAL